MYITMNRFRIKKGREAEFEEIWRTRESYLHEAPGFVAFHFLRGPEGEYISHTLWESKEAFEGWVGSESFHKAHARAGQTPKDLFEGPAKLSFYDVLLSQGRERDSNG
ncbi:MAG: antibiotic biosynthesis monooxygenase [Candidatus Tectomicrobia bacterium]|uniref:Antibiotic biosynthesis monooxygenase n=1 Tax=Tectimicrobiota bacterium TaxID=2528274 RepID=A0A933E7U6_UNCTE|nr:antibiotic biosynthesis monooxygenase [Candidatus Tectomicrobia bacterium]